MSGELVLVGSILLDTPREVFEAFGTPLGKYLFAMPDGEVGPRRHESAARSSGKAGSSIIPKLCVQCNATHAIEEQSDEAVYEARADTAPGFLYCARHRHGVLPTRNDGFDAMTHYLLPVAV